MLMLILASMIAIQDTAELPLLNPDLKSRATEKVQLANGLNVLLISDPAADQSAAGLAVKVGSWDDPAEYPGMAHFCEHMLFLGSEKYPAEGEAFMKSVADGGGMTNAFTAPDRTVYMFSAKHAEFFAILDQFAHFFIDPLLRQSQIARELHAVDQEHAKNIEHDGWREYMVFKELSSEDHPNRKFSTGNAETLGKIPAAALKKWYEAHYTAEEMHLVLYSNAPLAELKSAAGTMFSTVRSSPLERSRPEGPITSATQRGHIVYLKPVQERQQLTLFWELPDSFIDDANHSAELLEYALSRGHSQSLYERLNREELINNLGVHADKIGHHPTFQIVLELTPKGLQSVGEVGTRCFEALRTLEQSGLPKWLFDEKNRLNALGYQYQPRESAFEAVQSLATILPDEPLASFPRGQILGATFDAEAIRTLLRHLSPTNCCVTLTAPPKLTGVEPTTKETWMQAEYAVRPLPNAWREAWERALPSAEIAVGNPNPFVPERLEVTAGGSTTPQLVSESDKGVAYFARVPEFSAPEAAIHFHVRSANLDGTPRSNVLGALYLDHLTDQVHSTLLAAKAAGLGARFSLERMKLNVQIQGFSDKAPRLLAELLSSIAKAPPPTPEQFAKYMARHERGYANKARELPAAQAKMELESLLSPEKIAPAAMLEALRKVTYEDLVLFQKSLWDATYLEALFAGNLTTSQAKEAWLEVQHHLHKTSLPKERFAEPKVLELPESGGPFQIARATEAQGHGAMLGLDLGAFTLEMRAVQEINNAALREAFFNELRTKQKTGYIVKADMTEIEGRLFQFLLVQSNSHQPDDLLHRYELFLEEYLETLRAELPEKRFEALRDSCIRSLETKFRNLEDKAALWDLIAFQKGADFAYVEKRIAALRALTYDRFVECVAKMLGRTNRKRLAVLVEGRVRAPFAYQEIEPARLMERGGKYVVSQ